MTDSITQFTNRLTQFTKSIRISLFDDEIIFNLRYYFAVSVLKGGKERLTPRVN